MTICELDIGWAVSENERRYLHWELLACDEVRGVFQTDREHTLAVLYDGDRFELPHLGAIRSRPHTNKEHST